MPADMKPLIYEPGDTLTRVSTIYTITDAVSVIA